MALPPVLLLDVDGVVNARRPGWGAAPHRAGVWSDSDQYEYPLRWSPGLLNRLRLLHTSGAIEIRWCSTWCPEADRLERLWRLPPLARALAANPVPKGADGWALKRDAAYDVLRSGRWLIWADDEAIPADDDVLIRAEADGRALLIIPSSARGLQPNHLDAIEAFAREQSVPDGHAMPERA